MANTTNFGWETPDDTDLVKDGAAAMRTLGNSIDASFVDLKGGTTNQILAKNSNTDLDFKWVSDATGIPATIFDAKGDIIVATAADTADRLAVGSNGQVLTADSTTATGLKWAASSAYTPSYTLLNTGGTNLTGAATITVSGISGKTDLLIIIDSASSASASSEFSLRFNSDTGANYLGRYGVAYGNSSASQDNVTVDSGNTTSFLIARMSGNAASIVRGYAKIEGCTSNTLKAIHCGTGSNAAGANNATLLVGGGYWDGADVTSVSLVSSVGNFDAGKIFIYGA